MGKDIKTKDKVNFIKTKDNKENLKRYIMKKMISSAKNKNDDTYNDTKTNASSEATNQITDTAKHTFIKSKERSTRFIAKQKNKLMSKKYQNKQSNKLNELSSTKLDKTAKSNTRYTNINNKSMYNENMKKNYIHKHKIKHQQSSKVQNSKTVISKTIDIAKKTFTIAKKSVLTVSNIFSFGTGLLLMAVVALFIGVFGSLSDSSVYGIALSPLSEEVLAYTDTINKYTEQYGIEEFTSLVQAIMMHESNGLGNDPMNASSFIYNTSYPEGISNPDYSIYVGVRYLADCLNKANVETLADTDKIHLAIQSYNFGLDYIDWALSNFGGYSKANAQVYLDMKTDEDSSFTGNANYVANVWLYYQGSSSRIVEIAKSQIGNIGGEKYWKWYGFNSRVAWCACFVSWCAEQSGDLNVSIPRFSGVDYGMSWYKEHDKWRNVGYVPLAGEIVFFDWDYDKDPDHVGIVEKVENNTLYTIEGNSNDRCRAKTYNINSTVVLGYGIY